MIERYRDAYLVVVDKPSGLPSQPARGGSDSVIGRYTGATLPHRLDAAASGLLLVLLDARTHKPIADAFVHHRIRREYLAVADGRVAAGTWSWPVERKPATSHAAPLGHGQGMTALQLTLTTGRKHQLRVHAALAGHPLIGDREYGGDAARRWPRLALHACRLHLTHPVTDEPLSVEAPLPDDLRDLWARAGGPATLR